MAQLPQNAQYFFRYAHKAVEILVTYPGDIKERLLFAGEELLKIHPDGLPEQLKTQYIAIINYLTEFKADPKLTWEFNTDIRVTMRRRKSKTAVRVAAQIWSFYLEYETLTK